MRLHLFGIFWPRQMWLCCSHSNDLQVMPIK